MRAAYEDGRLDDASRTPAPSTSSTWKTPGRTSFWPATISKPSVTPKPWVTWSASGRTGPRRPHPLRHRPVPRLPGRPPRRRRRLPPGAGLGPGVGQGPQEPGPRPVSDRRLPRLRRRPARSTARRAPMTARPTTCSAMSATARASSRRLVRPLRERPAAGPVQPQDGAQRPPALHEERPVVAKHE